VQVVRLAIGRRLDAHDREDRQVIGRR
jgi:hypothetical protein